MNNFSNSNRTEPRSIQNQGTFRSDFIPPSHSYIEHQPFNSPFYQDHNEQEYAIQRAFSSNNYTYLRGIPDNLKHGTILNQRLNRAKETIGGESAQTQMSNHPKEVKLQPVGTLGYFQVFPYQQSLYGIEEEGRREERKKSQQLRRRLHQLDFRPSGIDKKMKYEDPFRFVDKKVELNENAQNMPYIFPFHIPQDTYDRYHECELRQKLIDQGNRIAGDFIPSQNQKSLTKINKSKISLIVDEIQQYLKKYLKGIGFFIGVNKRDQIQILFELKLREDTKVQLVMSKICEHELLCKFMLKRNHLKWSVANHQTNFVEFSVIPPWVKDPEQTLTKQSRQTS